MHGYIVCSIRNWSCEESFNCDDCWTAADPQTRYIICYSIYNLCLHFSYAFYSGNELHVYMCAPPVASQLYTNGVMDFTILPHVCVWQSMCVLNNSLCSTGVVVSSVLSSQQAMYTTHPTYHNSHVVVVINCACIARHQVRYMVLWATAAGTHWVHIWWPLQNPD